MNCAYHGQNVAVVNCNGCGKPLCPSCDHRVKGFPYCQDCIVSGVELLRNQTRTNYSTVVKTNTSPVIATLLSLICPGLGAAYNGQTAKALIHFAVFVGLIQMAIVHKMPVFVFGFLGMWLYTAVDAWKTARLIRSGVTPEAAEDFIIQRFSGNPRLWGVVLLVLGAAFFLPLRKIMEGVLPVALIIFGFYLLRDYIFKSKETEQTSANYTKTTETPTFSVAPASARYTANDKDFETETRVRAWKSRS
jgi:TM2 domain-containing membrane protein YozV